MSRKTIVCVSVFLSLFAASLSHPPQQVGDRALRRETSQELFLDNAYTAGGKWGTIDLCADGSFVTAVEIRYNPPGNLDETAINAIKLYCSTPELQDTGYVTSTQGDKGDWYGMEVCSEDFVTGFRGKVLENQGLFVDDVAVQDMELDCNYGREILDALPVDVPGKHATPTNFHEGTWSSFATCTAGSAVCGLQTRYEDGALGDATAIADAVFFCCERS